MPKNRPIFEILFFCYKLLFHQIIYIIWYKSEQFNDIYNIDEILSKKEKGKLDEYRRVDS